MHIYQVYHPEFVRETWDQSYKATWSLWTEDTDTSKKRAALLSRPDEVYEDEWAKPADYEPPAPFLDVLDEIQTWAQQHGHCRAAKPEKRTRSQSHTPAEEDAEGVKRRAKEYAETRSGSAASSDTALW